MPLQGKCSRPHRLRLFLMRTSKADTGLLHFIFITQVVSSGINLLPFVQRLSPDLISISADLFDLFGDDTSPYNRSKTIFYA